MRRVLLVLAAALIALVGVMPALAQDAATGEISTTNWSASFTNDQLNAGAWTVTDPAVSGSGTFRYKRDGVDGRLLTSVTSSVSNTDACDASVTGDSTTEGGLQRSFVFTVASSCNQTVRLTITGKADAGGCCVRTAHMTADITFAVPPTAVTDLIATVPDTASKEVTVAWAYPENAAPDTTYTVVRAGPDTDEAGWVDLTEALPASQLGTTLTDTVETNGVYRYRVRAKRPNVDEPAVATADVRVGPEPVDETPDTGSQSPVTQPGSASTITIPRLGSSRTPNRVSTHTTVTIVPQGPSTTIDTGFEETLDYGDLEEDGEPGELAAEGQSIIGSDDDGVVGPGAVAASVLVMIGWAGHVVYIRRLAAQF